MEWKEISIDDKDRFDRFFALRDCPVSDYTFTNLFIWHFGRRINYSLAHESLCLQVAYPDQPPTLLMPFGQGNLGPVLEELLKDYQDRQLPFRMRALCQQTIQEMERLMPGTFQIAPEPDRFDYVYSVQELIRLEGKKYKPKRNHINMFMQSYQSSYQPLTSETLSQVEEAEIDWCKKRDCESEENLENEKKGILEALAHFDRLRFQGGLLKIDGKVVAFTFGEELTKDTVVIHIEKADPDIRGAYQMINQQFLEHHWPHMTYVNREEDMGIAGLRKAKQSYHPVKMIEKYTAEVPAR